MPDEEVVADEYQVLMDMAAEVAADLRDSQQGAQGALQAGRCLEARGSGFGLPLPGYGRASGSDAPDCGREGAVNLDRASRQRRSPHDSGLWPGT